MSQHEVEDLYPLSPMQQGMMFQSLADPTLNVCQLRCHIEGLDPSTFRKTWQHLFDRHAVLRTSIFATGEKVPVQVVNGGAPLPLVEHDYRTLSASEQEARVADFMRIDLEQGLDLSAPSLIRLALIRLGDSSYEFIFTSHHIVLDGWSTSLLFREFRAAYESIQDGRDPALPHARPFRDFITWLQKQDPDRAESFWRQHLAGYREVAQITAQRQQNEALTSEHHYHEIQVALSRDTTAQLRRCARDLQVTLNTLVAGVWSCVLSRYSGRDDVVFGATVAGRPTDLERVESMVGMFINTLPQRVHVDRDATLKSWLHGLQRQQVEMREYEYSPLHLVQTWSEAPPRAPLFESILVFENYPGGSRPARPDGLTLQFAPQRYRPGVPVLLLVLPTEALTLKLTFDRDLLDPGSAQRLVEHCRMLFQAIASNPDIQLSELPWLTDAEREQVVVSWNRTDHAYARDACVHELFEAQAARTPDAVAVTCGSEDVTYAELDARANRLARLLQRHGVGPDVLVGIFVERSAEMLVAVLGVLKAGGAYVPLDPAHPKARTALVLEDADMAVLLTQQRLRDELPEDAGTVLCLDALPELAEAPAGKLEAGAKPDSLAYAIFTSGSTGRPKGVEISHRNVVAFLHAMAEEPGIVASDSLLAVTTLSFDIAALELYLPLCVGARVVIAPTEVAMDGRAIQQVLVEEGITVMQATPATWQMLVQMQWPGDPKLKVLCGGEALPRTLANALLDRVGELWNMYGPTETTIWSSVSRVTPGEDAVTIGRPIANERMYLLDGRGEPLPVGVPGELYIGGRGVARGYVNEPGMTATRFVPDPFSDERGARLYRTGDVARYRADGNIDFLGRADHQVKLRGYRIELGEIESLLNEHPAVRESVALVREDVAGNRKLVAYVCCDESVELEHPDEEASTWTDDHLEHWQTVWSSAEDHTPAEAAFNIGGWGSSYTGGPIPAEEMRTWVDTTVARIRSTGPDRVLEIGCGNGLLLLRLVPHCTEYVGVDFSQPALDYVARQLDRMGDDGAKARLEHRRADDCDDLPRGHFDTVILNSVVQYFPTAEYLRRVLEGAVAALRPGGRIFVGDVRSLPLLEAFHASVQLARATADTTCEHLRHRVQHEASHDQELVIDPSFFTTFAAEIDGIGHVELEPKLGGYDNEMSRFRYDVILHVGPDDTSAPESLAWRPWHEAGMTVPRLRALLETERPRTVALSEIPNRRVAGDVATVDLLAREDGPDTADAVRDEAARRVEEAAGVEPDDLRAAGDVLGYDVHLSVKAGRADGSFDMVLARRADAVPSDVIWRSMPGAAAPDQSAPATNRPLHRRFLREVVPHLRQHAGTRLPDYMVPSVFCVLDELPLTPNGKIDRRALPALSEIAPDLRTEYVAPRTGTEEVLCDIWADVLGVERVGVHDDFFELGGHSLIATQLVSRMRDALNVDLPLRAVLEHPTIAELAVSPSLTDDGATARPPIVPVERAAGDEIPLSYAQQRLWFLDQMGSGTAYNMRIALRLLGELDVDALRQSVQGVADRHEILRTRLPSEGGRARQTIEPMTRLPWTVIDLEDMAEDRRQDEALAIAVRDIEQPFDLAAGPLFRATLIRVGAQEHVFLFTIHHVISDGWSFGVIRREISAHYRALVAGERPALPDLPVQYADFSTWQRAWLEGDVRARELEYWTQTLTGATLAEIPGDRPRPVNQTFVGAREILQLSPTLLASLKELCQDANASLYMVLLAALDVLLHRYTGQDDIVVGSPIAGRGHSELESLIGCFVNTLVMRTDVSGNPTFEDVLSRARETALDAYAHQDLPFEMVVEALQPERDLSRNPFFQVLLVVQNAPSQSMDLADVSARWLERSSETTRFDIEIHVGESDGELGILAIYNTDLFDDTTIQRLLGHYQKLLEAIASSPKARLSELSWLTEEEREQVVAAWNRTEHEHSSDLCTHQIFEMQVQRTPERAALEFDGETLSYRELNDRANRLARFLRSRGAGPDRPVGICVERSIEMVVGVLGVLKAGAGYLPLDPTYPEDRLAYMADDARCELILTQASLQAKVETLDAATSGRNVVCLDRDWPTIAQEHAGDLALPVDPDTLAYAIYTSGSTGRPKGVMMPHRPLVNLLHWQMRTAVDGAEARTVQFAPFSFDVSFQELFATLGAGGTLILISEDLRRDSVALLAFLRERSVTRLFAPFVALRQLVEVAADTNTLPTSLLEVITAGEQLQITPALVQFFKRLPQCRLQNQYGPAECHVVTALTLEGEPETWPALPSIGRPIANTRIYLLDDYGQPVPVGVPGELYIGGTAVSHGYLHAPDLTAERFVPDPFDTTSEGRLYRTGDRARYAADGTIEFLGRVDHQVKLRGYRIEPGEIEALLMAHEDVGQAVAMVREDRVGDRRLVSYVVGEPKRVVSAADLKAWMKDRVPDYMVPSAFVTMETLPLTPSGKVDRKKLPAVAGTMLDVATEYVAPRNGTEEVLCDIWADVLGVDRVGVHDDFFELGGHSLIATQLVSRMRDALEVDIPLRAVFEHATIAELAASSNFGRDAATLPPPIVRVQRERDHAIPLSHSQMRFWYLEQFGAGAAYTLRNYLRLQGDLDADALEKSVRWLLERHEVLRTCFPAADGLPTLRITDAPVAPLTRIDLGDLDEEERERESARIASAQLEEPFDLANGPLMKTTLIRLSRREHILLITLHHIVSDGWSGGILRRELAAAYDAYSRGASPALPDLPVQYADFAHWQNAWMASADAARQLTYWQKQLGDDLPVLRFPTDRPRPAVQTFNGAGHWFTIPDHVVESTRALGRGHGVTANMTLLAAFKILLARYTGQEDIVLGSPIANRNHGEIEDVIGCFVNNLVLRTDLAGDPTVSELLRRVQRVSLDAYEHQDLPFDYLVEALAPARDLSRNPLYQVVFALHAGFTSTLTLRDLTIEPIAAAPTSSRTDVALHLWDHADQIAGHCVYNTDLFDPATIRRFSDHYVEILERMCADPDLRVSELQQLGEAEREQVLVEWNRTDVEFPAPSCVHALFEAQVARTPDAIAIRFEGAALSFRELDARANRLAHRLRSHGVGPDVLVALCVERSLEMVIGLLAVLKAGGAYVPLDSESPTPRLDFMLEDTAAPVLLTQAHMRERFDAHAGHVLCLDSDAHEWADEPDSTPMTQVRPEHPAYVIYTSGSTGHPKGVLVPHRAVCNHLRWMQRAYPLAATDRFLQKTPLTFDASVWEIYGPLLAGAEMILAAPGAQRDPDAMVEAIRAHDISVLKLVPTQLSLLLDHAGFASCSSLRWVSCGGEGLPTDLADRFASSHDATLVNLYGPTETTVCVTSRVHTPECDRGQVPIGRPADNARCYVLDRSGRPVAAGVPGELHISGDAVAAGYLNRPALTAERFVPDPFRDAPGARMYRTGDLCRHLPDGSLEFIGRLDDQVKIRGLRIELGEIEAALRKVPSLQDATVLCREDEPGEKLLVAYVVGAGDDAPSREVLREHLNGVLPAYMVPSAFVFRDALPLSASGKVDRRALPAPTGERDLEAATIAPRSELEEQLCAIWCDVLGLDEVGVRDNFFDLGGHSLRLVQVHARLRDELKCDLRVTDLFQHPTIERLARRLRDDQTPDVARSPRVRPRLPRDDERASECVAVIAMAGRFPGASSVDTLWQNLRDGVEGIHRFSDEELRAAGVPEETIADPNFIRARGFIEDIDLFDAWFFGYNPREAEMIDPQQRVFLECAWEALETAGYDPERYDGAIGVYAGTKINDYQENLRTRPDLLGAGDIVSLTSADKDFLATRVSYKLNLRGPSMNVQTTCSTSLVAIHEACRSLLDHQCDMAIAGGVSLTVPVVGGYYYQESGIQSPDGHCRAFDARAQGTVGSSGVALVVLKRLDQALADGDRIHAVVRGTAVNNDGSLKVGFTAPSVEGQAEVIALAQARAGVAPDTIGYVEAHGTGTSLGDPIEVAALTKAFGYTGGRKGYCAIGSIKSNLGHLNHAAGAAGFIKAALTVEHGEIPPSLHIEHTNPEIDFENSPFFVNAEHRIWPRDGAKPRRAAVSSFGLGGTNAHAILEEAPALEPSGSSRSEQLLVLSACSGSALDEAGQRLARHLRSREDQDLADVAYTLQVGRRQFEHRRAVLGRTAAEAAEALEGADPDRVWTRRAAAREHPVVFLFPGQGAQYIDMARDLYRDEPVFRATVDECLNVLEAELDFDLRALVYPDAGASGDPKRLTMTSVAQPALFVVEYALAQLWRSWGIEPAAMIGHSSGEYVAACVSGVLELDDALRLVAARGRLMEQMPEGVMLSVPLGEDQVRARLAGAEGLWLAAVNAPSLCVVSGSAERIDELARTLAESSVETRRLHTSHAFHSGLMDAAVEPFVDVVRGVELGSPRIPYLSNVTGDWITDAEVKDPGYWGRHIRHAVRFADGIGRILAETDQVLLEVGPGQVLGALARQHPDCGRDRVVVSSLRHPQAEADDTSFLMGALGRLWTGGVDIDWARFHDGERRRRVALPTYPFQRKRCWIERRNDVIPTLGKRADVAKWLYVPTWKPAPLLEPVPAADPPASRPWLLLVDGDLERALVAPLAENGRDLVVVSTGDGFHETEPGRYVVDPRRPEDYHTLIQTLAAAGRMPTRIVHGWSIGRTQDGADPSTSRLESSFYSVLQLAQALGAAEQHDPLELIVLTNGVQCVAGTEAFDPITATVQGLCRVIPQELPHITTRTVDLDLGAGAGDMSRIPAALAAELALPTYEPVIAYRGPFRWAQSYDTLDLPDDCETTTPFRERGTYLITGGLGRIGLTLAEWLARAVQARLVLTTRSFFPERDAWDDWVREHDEQDRVRWRIERVRAIEAAGGAVLVMQAEAADAERMRAVIQAGTDRFGPLHGAVHAAGLATLEPIQSTERTTCQAQLAPKVEGLLVLDEALRGHALDFRVVTSSLSAVLGGVGMAAYASANAFMDAFAWSSTARGETPWLSVNWDGWRFGPAKAGDANGIARFSLTGSEGMVAFERTLRAKGLAEIVVSTGDLQHRRETWVLGGRRAAEDDAPRDEAEAYERPDVSTEFAPPETDLERALAAVWEEVLGIEGLGRHDDFFELGGHSLIATQLVSRMRDAVNVEVSLRTVLESPTIAKLAAGLDLNPTEDEAAPSSPIVRVERRPQDEIPLSHAQTRLWFLEHLGAGTVYTLWIGMRVRGDLDAEALDRSLHWLIERHEGLRTTFPSVAGRPIQRIAEAPDAPLTRVDLEHLPEEERETEAQQRIAAQLAEPFDLAEGPLFRPTLIRLGQREHILAITLHHIITDAWSGGVLRRELALAYDAFTRGEAPAAPELPIQYADFAQWQNAWMESPRADDQLEYWKEHLHGLSVLDLPTDRPRPAMQTFDGSTHPFAIPDELVASLRELSRRHGVTLNMTLLAAFKVLLARYSGQSDIVVGSPIANRHRQEIEGLVGLFLNNLVLRTDLGDDPTFVELLGRVQEVSLEAYDHQDLPFDHLVEAMDPDRDLSRTPLYQVTFTLQKPTDSWSLGDLEIEPVRTAVTTAQTDVGLHLYDQDPHVGGTCTYCTGLFDEATIERFVGHYLDILERVAADPDRRLSELQELTGPEREQVLVEWNRTERPCPDCCLHELFEAQVARTPDAIAVTCGTESLTYAELDVRANRLAHRLLRLGLGAEMMVGIYVERSVEMLVGVLGVLKAGGAYVPLDPMHPETRTSHILESADVPILLTQEKLRALLAYDGGTVVCLDTDPALADAPADKPAVEARPDALAYAIFTSGSTGRPKGVMVSHRNVVTFLEAMRHEPGIVASDALLAVTTLSFDIAALELYLPLCVGARVVIATAEIAMDGHAMQRALRDEGITMMQATPATWQMLVQMQWPGDPNLKMLCGGEALPRPLADALLERGGELWNMYGPTETTIWSSMSRVAPGETPITIGRPIANEQLYVLNEALRPVPIGTVGELYIGGVGLARGYVGRPDLTAERFVPDPFAGDGRRLYRTGDLVRHHSDGSVEFRGRNDHQIKIRGYRIELGEIEAALARHPDVRESVVLCRDDGPGGKHLVAYVCGRDGAPSEDLLRAHMRSELPEYMVPSRFLVLEVLPLTPNGKLDRKALPAPDGFDHLIGTADVAPPETEMEQQMAEVWEEVLGIQGIGRHDRFFDLGGHSLLSVQVVVKMNERTGALIELRGFFYQTLMQIAAGCEKQVRQSEIEVDPSVGPVGKLLGTIKKTLKSGRRKPNGAAPAEAHGTRRSDR